MHPRERMAYDRRRFLRNSLYWTLGAAGGPALLSACGSNSDGSTATSATVPMARPDNPVELPLHDDLQPIEDGLEPEDGKLKIFNYADYLAPGVLKAFADQYDVPVPEVTTFASMDQGVATLRTGQATFDVFFPTPDILAKIAVGKLLQPLNHSYLPNLENALADIRDPFYDRGSRYTVPYNVYSTGVGYRTDEVSAPPTSYDVFWDEQYAGQTHILDDGREAIGMSLLRNGVEDVNTEDPAVIQAAGDELRKLVSAVKVKVDINGYTEIPENRATIHQSWSGDMINAANFYLPKGENPEVVGFWRPDTGAVVGNDTIAVVAGAANPVLAHHFLDFMLDNDNALRNFKYVGYQPALQKFTPSYMASEDLVQDHLQSAVVTLEQYHSGKQLLQLSAAGRSVWDDVWATFKSG